MLNINIKMPSLICAGCHNELKELFYLSCCLCTDNYHHTCLNFSDEQFLGFTKEYKDTWVCPSCRCSQPKSGDNSNTPVRGGTASTVPKKALPPASRAAPPRAAPSRTANSRSAPTTAAPAPAAPAPIRTDIGQECDNVTLRSKPRSNCQCLSGELIRDIIREELDRKFNSQIKDIQSKLSNIEVSLSFYGLEFDRINRESEAQKQLLNELRKDNEELRANSSDLARRVHRMEQLSRTENLEIQCVPEYKTENLYNTIQQIGKTIKCPVVDSDIQYCSRIAKLNNNSPRPRSVLVKFSSRRLRDTFLAGVIKFNRNNSADKLNSAHLGIGGKKSAVFVSEHLTSETKSLHAAARLRAKQLNYKFVWVRDSKVFMRKTENSNYIHIKSADVLSSLS